MSILSEHFPRLKDKASYSVRELSRGTGISRQTIGAAMDRGDLKYFRPNKLKNGKPSRGIRISAPSVEKWLKLSLQ